MYDTTRASWKSWKYGQKNSTNSATISCFELKRYVKKSKNTSPFGGVSNDVLSYLYWVYDEFQLELQKGSNVKILLFFSTLSATVPRCRICTKSTYGTSEARVLTKQKKIVVSTSKLKFSGWLPLAQPDWSWHVAWWSDQFTKMYIC